MRESVAARWLSLVSRGCVVLGLAGCSGSGVFECDGPTQCSIDGQVGTCEPDGYCSFPDESCPSGSRYAKHAAAELAGSCVPSYGSTGSFTTASNQTSAVEGSGGTTIASTGNPPTPDGTTLDPTTSRGADDDTTTSLTASTTGSTGPTASTTASTSGQTTETGGSLVALSYPAALAECNDPVTLDPDACELGGNPAMGTLVVDLIDTGAGPIHGYLRFDVDDALVPADVVSVTLRLVASNVSMSPSSGEVYRVEPFELMDLFSLQPATIGPVLAPDQGPVASGDVVQWPLPPDLFVGGETSLYLGVLPLSTDGIDYWNLEGAQPPELIVEQLR